MLNNNNIQFIISKIYGVIDMLPMNFMEKNQAHYSKPNKLYPE